MSEKAKLLVIANHFKKVVEDIPDESDEFLEGFAVSASVKTDVDQALAYIGQISEAWADTQASIERDSDNAR